MLCYVMWRLHQVAHLKNKVAFVLLAMLVPYKVYAIKQGLVYGTYLLTYDQYNSSLFIFRHSFLYLECYCIQLLFNSLQVHILPREMFWSSTFGLSMWLLKWLPMQTVDRFLLLMARFMLGDTSQFGLERPHFGPMELKAVSGKTPVLDVGTLEKIKSGDIKVLDINSTHHTISKLFSIYIYFALY